MTSRVDSVAAVCTLLFAPAALVGCSSSHHAGKTSNQGVDASQDVSPPSSARPRSRLIVLGRSIAGIRLDEPRKSVEKAFGPGKSRSRGIVWYFRGRLMVDYWHHDGLTTRVEGLQTKWSGFRTRSGVHIGTSQRALRALHMSCPADGQCGFAAGRMPDAPGTVFTMKHGKVAQIDIFYA